MFCSGAGLQGQPLHRVGQVGHVGLLGLVFDGLQGPNLHRREETAGLETGSRAGGE